MEVVDGWPGGVGAAAGEGPADDAGLRLFGFPAGGLLGFVVASAFGAEVALVGGAVICPELSGQRFCG